MIRKQAFFILFIGVIATSVLLNSCSKDVATLQQPLLTACDSMNVKYSTVINPLFVTNCSISGCHDGTGSAPGDFGLYADVKSYADNGLIRSRVITLKDMPSTGALPDSLIKKLQCWLDAGAPNN